MTPIFSGGSPGENRLREYTRLGCNQTYYDVNYEKNMPDQCKDLLHSVNIWVFDGAEGNVITFQEKKVLLKPSLLQHAIVMQRVL